VRGRARTLGEVAARSEDLATLSHELAEFLDEFYREGSAEVIKDEPGRLEGAIVEGDVADAYLAATAVALARGRGAQPPRWAMRGDRRLDRPWFASRGAAVRATLLLESPAPFRERNLFVSENALARA
jgi:hypothetical protein